MISRRNIKWKRGVKCVIIRTINGAVAYLRQSDPGSAVTASYIRRLVRENKIPYMMDGTRVLVNVSTLIDFLTKQN